MNMKKKLLTAIIALSTVFTVFQFQTAGAIDLFPKTTCSGDVDCSVVKSSETELSKRVQNIINVALFLMGGVAVIMIIVGALRMMIANGDPGNIKSGRLTIMWSVVGVAVILLASAIVNFVVNWGWLD